MLGIDRHARAVRLIAVTAMLALSGCTSFSDYVRNGFKVGPNYCPPQAAAAKHWIDAADIQQPENCESLCHWWTVFNDPKLNELVYCAYRQNLTLRQAAARVLQARARLGITAGELFPQQQQATGDYRRVGSTGNNFSDLWDLGFRLQWEVDFWGRLRRAVISDEALLDASVDDFDAAVVTMLGDIASNYIRVRTDQERIKLLEANIELQRGIVQYIQAQFNAGFRQSELDLDQAISNLRQTEAGIQPLEINRRQAEDALCVLLGIPPVNLSAMLGTSPIPTAPPEVAIGIPCDLVRRRPDVRAAERRAAAQAEEIGIAAADLYPTFTVNGTMGWTAQNFPDLFRSSAFNGSVGPSFQWNLLNYGRIANNVRLQDAAFQELVAAYQQSVLLASQEVEDGLVTFLRSQRQTKLLDESVTAASNAVKIVVLQYKVGAVDFNRYAVIEQNLVTQQDQAAASHGLIAQGLVETYRALGGAGKFAWDPAGPADPCLRWAPTHKTRRSDCRRHSPREATTARLPRLRCRLLPRCRFNRRPCRGCPRHQWCHLHRLRCRPHRRPSCCRRSGAQP